MMSSSARRILHAARQLLEQEGPDGVSMRRVAATAGLSPMATYRHFANREALLERICEDSFEEIARHWQARGEGQDPMQRLLALHELPLDYALSHPYLYDHAFSVRRSEARRFPEDFRAGRSPTLTVVADTVREAIDAGLLREHDPWDLAMDLWAHTHGLIALYRAGRFSLDAQAFRTFYRASLLRMLDGLRPPAGISNRARR